jgi:cytochrome b561
MTVQTSGYSKTSIVAHWIAAIGIIALFFTHEGERGSMQEIFHVSGGAVLGVFILWRALRRPVRGFADKPDQPALLNLVSSIVLWGLLASMVIVVITGYFLPWSRGNAIDIFGLVQLPSPISPSNSLHEIMEEAHEVSGTLIMPLIVLHILGALKHAIIDKDGVMQRMVKSVAGGR